MSLLLKNATYIDWQSLEFFQTNIFVEEGIHGSIRFIKDISSFSDSQIIDCTGKIVTKSFAVGHHHAYSAMAKGMPPPKKIPENFPEILKYVWWNLDKCLDEETIEYSALLTAMACAKAGSTFVIDHHASPNFIKGSLEILAKAFTSVGIGHLLCYEITDRDGPDKAEQGISETADYLQNHEGLVGLHASFTVGDDTLKKSVALANQYQTGIHIHVAEDLYDQIHCEKTYNKRLIQRFADAGALESGKSLLVHCLHLDADERRMIRSSPVWLVQNAESNMNNNVGHFNGMGLGERIMLGTDGMHSDMLQSAKAAFFIGQCFDTINYSSAYERFRNVHHYLQTNNFSGDGENNLVVLDYDSGTELNQNNFAGHFIFGMNATHITHVISQGKLIVQDKELKLVDEAVILHESRKIATKLWGRL
ncbi:MAG: amidohydrolase family protein [Bacteroidales bacterium]|nr:amidohydrolase family protein [Bacteroidales bacterium]